MVLIEYAHGVLVEYVRCKHFPCVVCDFPGHQLSLIYFHFFSGYYFVFIVWYIVLLTNLRKLRKSSFNYFLAARYRNENKLAKKSCISKT